MLITPFLLIHPLVPFLFSYFFFNDTATTEIYTLSLHDALPISQDPGANARPRGSDETRDVRPCRRSEEHTSELQSHHDLVCRLLLEKKKKTNKNKTKKTDKFKTNHMTNTTTQSHDTNQARAATY